ncbi:unnamed protein product [Nesidiocoris tenuis]|uniref:Uncharacterized protein n=1 Tax=Nesidiocoris tenuis TaxID=355587 RepID=A0A6H5G052_9HEMI|nr:unnamed protein product [Nesidiocoris tenuis]
MFKTRNSSRDRIAKESLPMDYRPRLSRGNRPHRKAKFSTRDPAPGATTTGTRRRVRRYAPKFQKRHKNSIDGQHIYLHSINAKMLEMTYGSLENCPPTIRGKIVEKEPGSMTGELRKRLKYLQHVPITCQFEVVELELAPPLVSSDAVATFHDQIELRKKRRYKLARAEKRREKKIEEHERRQFGRGPAPNLRIESHFDFPECGELFEHSRPPGPSSELDKASEGSSRPHSPVNSFESYDQFDISQAAASFDTPPDDNGMSFAQMLRDGKTIRADSTSWPTVGQTGQSWAVGAAASGSCWSQPRRQRQASVSASVESDSENYALSPPARSSFNIAEALEAAARLEKGVYCFLFDLECLKF